MSDLIVNTTDATFGQDVLRSECPVLLDFWAPWCSPCKALNPMLERLAAQYAGRVRIVKLNVDENPETARLFHVRGIPRLMLFARGELQMPNVAHSQAGLKVLFEDLTKALPGAVAVAPAPAVAAAVPSFGGDPARKADYLRRLRAATFETSCLPADSVATDAGAFAVATGGPETLGKLLNGLWWTLNEPESPGQSHDWVVSFMEAIPVGVDLARISLAVAHWMLHDPELGSAQYAPTDATRDLCGRLAALHRRELDGERIPEHEWSALQRDVVALAPPPFDPDTATEPPDWSPEQGFMVTFERLATPLAECDMSGLFSACYGRTLSLAVAHLGCWSGQDQQQMQSVYEATWKALLSTLGERPADEDAEALARWEARMRALRDQVRPTVRKTHPELQARVEAWERIQQDQGSRLANIVGDYFKALCASAPRIAAPN
ncbi:thioredoxin family protein [Cupriavidus sp. 30B13]|uniref:thioredoxin family protein n=1 Tax=Cupriavidus sp. 30B13 TaxID=3384241 RepID=UPI003B8EE366